MENYETHEHDVIVIGAGGAGLRAAIEASAGGVSVGLICKSLLGKAHTVMAEGGVAAAMGNVDSRDSWQIHFRDTMRGGKMLNNWRMAELHAREAPSGAALTLDFIKSGAEQTKTVTLADGSKKGTTAITGLSYTTLEEFGMKVKSVGTTDPGAEITILVHYHIKALP